MVPNFLPPARSLTLMPSILSYHTHELAPKAWLWRSLSALTSGTGEAS